jgi:acetolactate synthase-1/2/3 large subunit
MTVAMAICDQLATWGIDRAFGVSGANIELVFDAAVRHRTLDAVLAKHEAAATMMAMGWQERAGLPGVVLTTSGGGAFNIVAPLAEALDTAIPLVALVGQSPAARDGSGVFQDSSGTHTRVDAERILGGVAVHCERLTDPAEVLPALHRAFAAAIAQRGPAVLLLPRDVQSGPPPEAAPAPLPAPDAAAAPVIPPSLAAVLTTAVQSATPPLLIAGREAVAPPARDALYRLAGAWGAAVAVAPDAKAAYGNDRPRLLGVAGVMGHEEVGQYARRAPVCVLAGTRLPDVAGYALSESLPHATIVSLNSEPCFPGLAGHPAVHELPGPLATTLDILREATPPRMTPPPLLREAAKARILRTGRVSTAGVIEVLGETIEPGSDVFIDAGNTGAFAIHGLPARGDGLISVALGMGAMGHAFGAAVGACEHSGRRTYVIAGDGAFYMHGMEVHTALERRLPIVYVIVNNNSHAMCRLREDRLLAGETTANVFASARIGDGLRAMLPTLDALEIDSYPQLEQALRRARDAERPIFLSITVPADEQPPFWPLSAPNQKEQRAA